VAPAFDDGVFKNHLGARVVPRIIFVFQIRLRVGAAAGRAVTVGPVTMLVHGGAEVEPGGHGAAVGFPGEDLRGRAPRDLHGVHAHADLDLALVHSGFGFRRQRVKGGAAFGPAGINAAGRAAAQRERGQQQREEKSFHGRAFNFEVKHRRQTD